MPARAGAVARKEWFHIRRDPFTLALALVLPLLMVIVYGVAIDFNVKEIHLAVSDLDQSQASRRLIDTFSSSHYFRPRPEASAALATADLSDERARAALIIPPRFEKDLLAGRGAKVQILLDGADNSTVGPISQYVASIQALASRRLAGVDPSPPYQLRTRFLFNPELNSRWFVIPGLTVVIMAILSIFLTALTVAREWENGSMELLLSTPVEPIEIIVGKAAPYAALGILATAFVYVIARGVFGVPFAGHLWVFALGCLLFLVTYLAQGLLISVLTRQQTIAMQFSMLTGMLPSNLLSGFIFPIASMPRLFWYLTMLLPARWFMVISRHAFLEGSGFSELAVPFAALALSCATMVALAARSFRRTLE
ncbi:MAG: ABC transporter permease [Elusimicrobia bacterium]|nr:ABC transporter permease [Elusimicrobiota bacterium]MDE2426807.1 ABC transporter permease [Elusimicrobiota bacterium]